MNSYLYSIDNFINAVDTTSNGGYFIAGGYQNMGSQGNYFAAKLDDNGNEIWHVYGNRYNGIAFDNSAKGSIEMGCTLVG